MAALRLQAPAPGQPKFKTDGSKCNKIPFHVCGGRGHILCLILRKHLNCRKVRTPSESVIYHEFTQRSSPKTERRCVLALEGLCISNFVRVSNRYFREGLSKDLREYFRLNTGDPLGAVGLRSMCRRNKGPAPSDAAEEAGVSLEEGV